MNLFNLTQRRLMLSDLKLAEMPWEKLFGLLLAKQLEKGQGLMLKDCSCVHTFGMRFRLDLIFLDSHDRVVHMITCLEPNRISPWIRNAKSVIEMPADSLCETGVIMNDKLLICSEQVVLKLVKKTLLSVIKWHPN